MGAWQRHAGLLAAGLGFAAFSLLLPFLSNRPRESVQVEMQVALPRLAQLAMAGGDRFLAANIAVFRALTASTDTMGPENYRIQGLVQSDVAWFNPAHEDNYYIAAAILPWNGQVEAAQGILRRASDARPFDPQPPFYHAFNAFNFLKDPVEGSRWLLVAADHAGDENQRIQFQNLAARWAARGEDREFAIRLHRAMAKESRHPGFAAFLEKRAVRLENLLAIESALARYRERFGQDPASLQELAARGLLPAIPADPFGEGYMLDGQGRPQVRPASAPKTPDAKQEGKEAP